MGKKGSKGSGKRLQASDWEKAALAAIAESGIGSVAVEPLARRLGVTKGSFYWHFRDRAALLDAAVRRWEAESTERIIAVVSEVPDPRARLARLFGEVGAGTSARVADLYLAISAAGSDPAVRPFLQRVTDRRIDFIADCYAALGLSASQSRARALLAYAAYVGLLHVRREGSSRDRLGPSEIAGILRLLLPDGDPDAI